MKEDEAMDALCESIALYGILSPLLARPVGEGYEIISGHRRRAAALRLGLDKLPVLVRDMSDDEAVIRWWTAASSGKTCCPAKRRLRTR